MDFLDKNGLSYTIQYIKRLLLNKVDTVTGKQLSSNDYTDDEKNKLASYKTETWTFTLSDGSTVTKNVVIK